jgi:hypothetical protein
LVGAALAVQSVSPVLSLQHSANQLQSFYVVSFENYWLIVDVHPISATDTKLRFIQIYPACRMFHVQESDMVARGASVQELAGKADVCASEKTVTDLIKATPIQKNKYLGPGQSIVAECGESVVHHLPDSRALRLEVLHAKAPQIAALWYVPRDLKDLYARETRWRVTRDPDETKLAKRRLNEMAAKEIRNGAFDLAAPDLAQYLGKRGQVKLSEIVPEPTEAANLERDFGIVEDLFGPGKSAIVPYPIEAEAARVEGDVNIEISIDPANGSVRDLVVRSGPGRLIPGSVTAARRWVFDYPYTGPNPLPVKIHFEMRCPPEIAATTANSPVNPLRSPKVPTH